MRRVLLCTLAIAALGGGSAGATCAGTENTAAFCASDGVVYEDCVYLGDPPCTPVVVDGPFCVSGQVFGDPTFVTVWC